MKSIHLEHIFVEYIPENLDRNKLYISLDYNVVVHRCPCGCGEEVALPLSPRDWNLTYNGESVSIRPSIGNWSYECQSHYWIINDTVHWAKSRIEDLSESLKSTDKSRTRKESKKDSLHYSIFRKIFKK